MCSLTFWGLIQTRLCVGTNEHRILLRLSWRKSCSLCLQMLYGNAAKVTIQLFTFTYFSVLLPQNWMSMKSICGLQILCWPVVNTELLRWKYNYQMWLWHHETKFKKFKHIFIIKLFWAICCINIQNETFWSKNTLSYSEKPKSICFHIYTASNVSKTHTKKSQYHN